MLVLATLSPPAAQWLDFSCSAVQLLKNLEPFLQHSLSMVDTLRKEDEHAMQLVGEQIQTYK